jgi:nitroreductase
MDALEAIKSRKSVRSYKNQVPSRDLLDEIVFAIQNAPNAGAFSTAVVINRELLHEIDETVYCSMLASEGFGKERASKPGYRPLYGAPVCIILSGPKDEYFAGINTSCACTAGAYAATALGLGSCYIMAPKVAAELMPNLNDRLQLPEGFRPYCALLVGYTDDPKKFYHKFLVQDPAVYI